MIKVYRKISGVETELCSISERNATYKTAIMGTHEVRVPVITDSVLPVEEGDYIKLGSVNYTLNRDAEYTIESDVKYSYELVFEHPSYTLLNKLLANRITGLTTFTLTGKLVDFVQLIVWCVNESVDNPTGVDVGWSIGYIEDSGYKNITFQDINCYDALKLLAQEYGMEFYFVNDGKRINFVERIENTTEYVFEQGSGKGLYRIGQQPVDKEDTVTRLYVRGGNQNIPPEYADEEGYLKLPENYLEDFSEHSKVVEKKKKFEEEFPHFEGSAATVSGDNNKILTCPQIDFDLSAIAVGENARINFLTGDLQGNSFEFAWNNSSKQITLIEKTDDTALPDADGEKPAIPNSTKKAKVGDEFNFTGVLMPESYVTASIDRLRVKGAKYLSFYSKKRIKFTLAIDHRYLRNKPDLNAGDVVVISIPQKAFYQAIRITELEKNLHTGAITAIVSNYLEDNWEKYSEYQANLVKNYIISLQENIEIIDGVMYRDRGPWSADTAELKPYLNTSKIVDDAWNLGCRWRCLNNRTLEEPKWTSLDWQMIEGRSDARMEFDSSAGYAFVRGSVETDITPIVFIGNTNVSADIVEEQWNWTRESGDPVSDAIWNAQHSGQRVLPLSNEDMGTQWSKTNPVRFTCTATYPASVINQISSYIEV
ncbi:hypothetical protein SAMN05216357_11097 [Porphyromonadaceae bacterium KH3CP3RA]|nr:hypothetical protein SAMN05216357_11097 [Porphyromonadaceae bacterium KH3CP3RA]